MQRRSTRRARSASDPVPRAAPLLLGDRIVTISAGGLMNSFERASGRLQWSANLVAAGSDAVRACGYSASPLAFEELVITTAGGPGRGVVALEAAVRRDGVAVAGLSRTATRHRCSSISTAARVVVVHLRRSRGPQPRYGTLEWSRPHAVGQGVNVATPIWGADTCCSSRPPTTAAAACCSWRGAPGQGAVEEVGDQPSGESTSATPCATASESSPRMATSEPRRSPPSTSTPAT